jgi:hypothetical protein
MVCTCKKYQLNKFFNFCLSSESFFLINSSKAAISFVTAVVKEGSSSMTFLKSSKASFVFQAPTCALALLKYALTLSEMS